jgi:urease accessory protein UreE
VPAALSRLGQRFAVWRKARTTGERIPESLWDAAAKMTAKYGLNPTARALKLDYYSLKKRVDRADHSDSSSTFVELPSSPLVSNECVIEWEDAAGARMRVHVKGQNLPDVLALSRSFWNAD